MTVENVQGFTPVYEAHQVNSQKQGKQQKVDLSTPVDTIELSSKDAKPSKKKKFLTGLAATLVSGLGYTVNGDFMKGMQVWAGHVGIGGAALAALAVGQIPVALLLLAGEAVYDIASIVDSVKNTKP